MSETKFYHYNIWLEDDVGNRLNPIDNFSTDIFSNSLYDITEKEEKHYSCQFELVRSNEYYGVLIRTKDDSGFVRLREDGSIVSLADATDDEGATGDINFDYVDFAIKLNPANIDVLVEVGFQTPGIGMIKEYLDQHIDYDDDYSLEHENRLSLPSDEKIERLLDSELKKVNISFKKNPSTYEGLDVEGTLKSLIPDDYRLEFSVSLHRGKNVEKSSVREFMGQFTSWVGVDDSTVEESISKIDFPQIMHSFDIVGIEGEEEVEENLADVMRKEVIDTSRYGISDPELGEELCARLRNLDD